MGWKVQHSNSLDSGSLTSRMHRPSSVFQMRRVPSSEVDTMMSLLRDQAKSVTGAPWPFRVTFTLGGDGDSVMMDKVPSREQQARRCLSSLANCNLGTTGTWRGRRSEINVWTCLNKIISHTWKKKKKWLTGWIYMLVEYVVHPSKGIIFTQSGVSCHGTTRLCHRGGHQTARRPGTRNKSHHVGT